MANDKVDVVIVGAGASGSAYAAVLAKAGKKVVMLDGGPDWELKDLISSDFWGRRIKPAGAPFLLEGKNPFGYAFQTGWGVGGAALHYFANFPRLLPVDFKVKSEHGKGLDWPISYADVAPWYDRVADDIGVSGDAKAEERWRPAGKPYPMPPMMTFKHGEAWVKPCADAGINLVPAAVAMNSREFKGRPACVYDGWCHVGCPTGALANPQVTYLADARKAGVVVRARSNVTRVLTNEAGTRVTGVEYYDAKKEKQTQEASVVVLAAWTAENVRLMLNSATSKHDRGLANKNGLVGKYITCHYGSNTWAMFDGDMQNHMGTSGSQFASYDRYGKTSTKGNFGSSLWTSGSALKTSDLSGFANARGDLFGPPLHDFMKRAAKGLTRLGAFGEEMPNAENRIELATTQKDEFGMPFGRIIHTYDEDAVKLWNTNFDVGLEIAKSTGVKEVWSGRGNQPTIHMHGGTIMGTSAADSVATSFGQTHEIPNLYIAGGGLFPTEGASNPTYTIFALSLRGSEQLVKNWSTVAG
jgi:choline dehydrogenase-like flavoprotein